MATYQTTKCGHCNTKWSFMQYGEDSSCGAPIIKCINCKGLNKTKMKLYRDMNSINRFMFWIGRGFVKPLASLVMIAVGIYVLYRIYFITDKFGVTHMSEMLEINNWLVIIFSNVVPLVIVFMGAEQIKDTLSLTKQLKLMEKTFDENGGFVWSNQQY